jgi:predicted dehydrogenase
LVSNVAFGRYHQIDVEDEATAILRHQSGMTGLLQASSGEAPGINRLEIIGDHGSLTWNDSQIILSKSDRSVSEHCATTSEMFGMPSFSHEEVALPESTNQHAQVLQNMTDTLSGKAQPLTPATEGIGSLQLANAMLLSEWTGGAVNLPIDATRYESLLRGKIEGSSLRVPADTDVEIDMEKSFR